MKFLHIKSTKNESSENEDTVWNPLNIDLGHEHMVDYYSTLHTAFLYVKMHLQVFRGYVTQLKLPSSRIITHTTKQNSMPGILANMQVCA